MRQCAARVLMLAGLATLLAGCSSLSALKFWESDNREKPAELKPIAASARVDAVWRARVGEADGRFMQPAVAGEAVYAAAAGGDVQRIEKGRVLWRARADQKLSGAVAAGSGIVVAGGDHGRVYAFDAETGAPRWKIDLRGEISAVPFVDVEQVYVRVGDAQIVALSNSDGRVRWTYQRTTPPLSLRSFNGMTRFDQFLFAGFSGGRLAALAANTGQLAWEGSVGLPRGATELERLADVVGEAVHSGQVLCAAAYQTRVTCFDVARGQAIWGRDISSSVGVDADARRLYVTDEFGAVFALDLDTGATLWKQDALRLRAVSRPLSLDDHVVVGDMEGWVHVLRKEDGQFAARFKTDGSPIASPLRRMGSDGFVAQTVDGSLYALTVR